MRAVRVMQVVLSLNAGGTERLVVELARRLHREMPMAVCCLDERGAWAGELEREGIRVEALRRPPGFAPALGAHVARLAREHRATVLHCHHYSPFVYGCLARLRQPGVRVVFTEHGRLSDAPPSWKRRVANVAFARLAGAAFAVSDDLRRHLLYEGFGNGRMSVIYNGIDIGPVPGPPQRDEVRRRLRVPNGTLVIGTIARLDPVKDLRTLIAAVGLLRQHHPALLVVVGDGPERAALEAAAARAGAADSVRFLGHRDDAREWLAGCDVYANSSISEGVSLTILEAMAAALPVVATSVGGTPEVVDEQCARLVPARSPEALADALAALASAPELRKCMGAAGRRRVEERFTLDRMVREYRDVYARMA